MEITKRQALSLVKALSHYNSLTMVGTNYSIINDTDYLLEELEEFILDERQEDGNKESVGPVTYIKLFDRELQVTKLVDLATGTERYICQVV